MAFTLCKCRDPKDFTDVKIALEKELLNIQSEQKLQESELDRKADEALKAGNKKTANEAKRQKKTMSATFQKFQDEINKVIVVAKDALWLTEKFGSGEWKDIPGLCKIATRAEIAEKNYSLTPGAYVGVAEVVDDDENFEERMKEIHVELNKLQNESNELMATINANLKELGLEA